VSRISTSGAEKSPNNIVVVRMADEAKWTANFEDSLKDTSSDVEIQI
jgi:hypothetical protein